MLVELRRATEDELGNATGEAPIGIEPANVAVFFGSDQDPNQTIVRLSNGGGYKIFGAYSMVKEALGNGAHFVELRRPDRAPTVSAIDEDGDFGEDDGIGAAPVAPAAPAEPRFLSVNPTALAVLHGDRIHSNQSIIKTRDGRGLQVLGTYAEVKAALEARLN